VGRGEWSTIRIEPKPKVEITDEQAAEIKRKIESLLPDGGENVDY